MACFHPIDAYQLLTGGRLLFRKPIGAYFRSLQIACGQCVGCRLERSRQWGVRCAHEKQMHEENSFITLTYSDEHMPVGGSLCLEDFQLFMKRLRKRSDKKFKFYHCGEYGERTGRAHYHACLFGRDFSDKKLVGYNHCDDPIYESEFLNEVWGLGKARIGELTFESACYVARYCMKKWTGPGAEKHYEYYDLQTGEVFERKPEYSTMSRRGGIGAAWLEAYGTDVYPQDYVVVNDKKSRPPRFYDGRFEISDPLQYRAVKRRRVSRGEKHAENNTPDRLKVREELAVRRLELLKREVE